MTKLKKWQLLSKIDVSPSPHFPLEKREFQKPDGEQVQDFYVTTLADCAHIVPITNQGLIVLIRMYKQGVDEVITQFPAGRFEAGKHQNMLDVAVQELREETGIVAEPEQLIFVSKQAVMTTKSSEWSHLFLVKDVEITATQQLDANEEIEVLTVTPVELDQMILRGEIAEGLMIADWFLIKARFPNLFK